MPINRQNPPGPAIRRRIVLMEKTAELPADTLEHRPPLCPHHVQPVPMQPIGESLSCSGDVMVRYGCGDPSCRYREGWGTDSHSGEPRRLIRGFDQSRR